VVGFRFLSMLGWGETVGAAGKEVVQEEGAFSLIPSSTVLGLLKFVCMLVLTPP
jgi:hypothetical protein